MQSEPRKPMKIVVYQEVSSSAQVTLNYNFE